MRLPRMTVRRWLVVVACIALSLGAVRLSRERAHHLRAAAQYAQWEAIHLKSEQGYEVRLAAELRGRLESGDATAEAELARARQQIRNASTMSALYAKRRRISERLASHP